MEKIKKIGDRIKRQIMAECMEAVCFPHHRWGKFTSLREILHKRIRLTYVLTDIVQYNCRYRNYLRAYGVENLIKELIKKAPKLKREKLALNNLCGWSSDNRLADYNIQCYHIKDKVTILGHVFNGLEDIERHCEMVGKEYFRELECWNRGEFTELSDVHIGKIYDDYPSFDSSDSDDDRTYRNYIFRSSPITEGDMKETFRTFHGFNFCMVHEEIKKECLPILYYSGEGEYMLLASNPSVTKIKRRKG